MYYSTGRYYFVLPAQYTRSTTTTLLPPCLYLDKYKKALLVGQTNSHQYIHIVLVRSGPPLCLAGPRPQPLGCSWVLAFIKQWHVCVCWIGYWSFVNFGLGINLYLPTLCPDVDQLVLPDLSPHHVLQPFNSYVQYILATTNVPCTSTNSPIAALAHYCCTCVHQQVLLGVT